MKSFFGELDPSQSITRSLVKPGWQKVLCCPCVYRLWEAFMKPTRLVSLGSAGPLTIVLFGEKWILAPCVVRLPGHSHEIPP